MSKALPAYAAIGRLAGAIAVATLLLAAGCVQAVPNTGAPAPAPAATGPVSGGLRDQSQTLDLENTDRINRFRRLASGFGTQAPQVDQLYAPPGSVPGTDIPAPVVRVMFSENAFFASGSAEPLPSVMPTIDLIAENMKRDVPDAALTLLGHTDALGSDASNMDLSRRRAAAVLALLIGRGVPLAEMDTVAIGKAQPIAPNLTAAGRARNRRVEFMISGSEDANLSVVTHRQVDRRYFGTAEPPPTQVGLYKPAHDPMGTFDPGFLHRISTLALAAPVDNPRPDSTTPQEALDPPAEAN